MRNAMENRRDQLTFNWSGMITLETYTQAIVLLGGDDVVKVHPNLTHVENTHGVTMVGFPFWADAHALELHNFGTLKAIYRDGCECHLIVSTKIVKIPKED